MYYLSVSMYLSFCMTPPPPPPLSLYLSLYHSPPPPLSIPIPLSPPLSLSLSLTLCCVLLVLDPGLCKFQYPVSRAITQFKVGGSNQIKSYVHTAFKLWLIFQRFCPFLCMYVCLLCLFLPLSMPLSLF